MKHLRINRRSIFRTTMAMILTLAAPVARASEPAPLPDKPFAEHRLVLQLSDSDSKRQGLVISVAYNLLKLYDPDKVAIEVVAFGPGIELLFPDNPNRKLIESLAAQGVKFDICLNTVDTIERDTGKRPAIYSCRDTGSGRGRTDPVAHRKWIYSG